MTVDVAPAGLTVILCTAKLTTHAVVDSVLDTFRDALGPDAVRYRNHVYRGLNYQRMLLRLNMIPDEIALAWACTTSESGHPGGITSRRRCTRFDELAPEYSIGDVDRVRQMVERHHKLRPCTDEWVDPFRVADRIDVTRGLLRNALTRSDIRQVVHAFPYDGFHALLVRTAARSTTTHPLRPLPMIRW